MLPLDSPLTLLILAACTADRSRAPQPAGNHASAHWLPALDEHDSVECSPPPDDAVIMRMFSGYINRAFYGAPYNRFSQTLYLGTWDALPARVISFTVPYEVLWTSSLGYPTLDPLTLQGEWRYFSGDTWLGWTVWFQHVNHTFELNDGRNVIADNYLTCSSTDPDEADCFVPTQYCYSHLRPDRLTGTYLARFGDAPDWAEGDNWDIGAYGPTDENFFLAYDIPNYALHVPEYVNVYDENAFGHGGRMRALGQTYVSNSYYQELEPIDIWPDFYTTEDTGAEGAD